MGLLKLVVAGLPLAAVVACAGQIGDHIADNQTSSAVVIYEVDEGRELPVARISAGARIPLLNFTSGECSATLLVAKDEGGHEVERRSEMFCPGEEWIIDGQADRIEAPTPTPVPA